MNAAHLILALLYLGGCFLSGLLEGGSMSAAAGAIKGASRLAAAPLGGGPDHRIDRIGQPIAAQCALRRLHVARTALTDGGATIFASAICAYPTAARSRGLSRKRAAMMRPTTSGPKSASWRLWPDE